METIPRAGDRILGPDGPVAATRPGYEPRQPQIDMANLVEVTIEGDAHALIEAGTGTGKSWGYLIPAILSGRTTVVSTDTIALQEQLIQKDLPFLARVLEPHLDRPLSFGIAKGRGNYACPRNAEEYLENADRFRSLGEDGAASLAEEAIAAFRSGAWDGDKATLKIPVSDRDWPNISGDDSCSGKQCPHAKVCPYLAAKARVEDADVIVANSTLYLLHHYVREQTGGVAGILPEHPVWIADEAHTLADKACDVFGRDIPQHRPFTLVRRLVRQMRALGLETLVSPLTAERWEKKRCLKATPTGEGRVEIEISLPVLGDLASAFFEVFHGATKDAQLVSEFPPETLAEARENLEPLVEALEDIRGLLSYAARAIDPEEEKDKQWAVDALDRSLRDLAEGLEVCVGEENPDRVRYVEIGKDRRTGGKTATLKDKPIETAGIFRAILGSVQAAVFTSATLAAGKGTKAFLPVAIDLGLDLEETKTMQVESPFDYPSQVIGYYPDTVPDSRHPDYHHTCAVEITKVLEYNEGRAFVLFTALRDMRAVFDLVSARTRYPLMIQGDRPKDLLLEEFKNTEGAVLFGVKTFWTGVDIPGDGLSCIIITRIPFPVPIDPLVAARMRKIKERGGNDFREYMLPHAIRQFRQGFGRLIRSKTDEGLFCCLDSRISSAPYGRSILNSLPNFPIVSKL